MKRDENRRKFTGGKYCDKFLNSRSGAKISCWSLKDGKCSRYGDQRLKKWEVYNGGIAALFYIRCQDCVDNARPSPTEKACGNADCRHGSKLQSISQFHKHSGKPDGRQNHCKDCVRDYQREYGRKRRAALRMENVKCQ